MFITSQAFLGTIFHYSESVNPSQTNQGVAIFYASLVMLPYRSQGIFTLCPSTTPFDLALGPDSPRADEPGSGTLRVSGHWILTNVCATQADILTSVSSTAARRYCFYLRRNAPLPINFSLIPQLRYIT